MEGHGGELLVSTLAGYGVDSIFTLSGGHIFSIYDGAVKAKWRIVDVRHEQTATFAAEGMAKLTRRPGVAGFAAGPRGPHSGGGHDPPPLQRAAPGRAPGPGPPRGPGRG